MDFNDPKEFDDPQVLDDQKGIPIGRVDFDNPKVYVDTSIFDGFVLGVNRLFFLPLCKSSYLYFHFCKFSRSRYFRNLHTAVLDNCISVQVPTVVGDDPLDCFRLHSLTTEQMDMIEAKQLTTSHNGRMIIEGKEELLTELIYKSTADLLKEIKQGIKAGFSSANHCVMLPRSVHFG